MDWLAFLLRPAHDRHVHPGHAGLCQASKSGDASVGERREMLEAHLAGLRLQMQSLAQSVDALTQKIAHYAGIERSLSQGPGPEKENHGNHPLPARTRQTEGDRR